MMGTATRELHERVQEGATGIEAPADGLGRYARWQARDFVTQKAGILLLVAVLMLYPMVAGTLNVTPSMARFAAGMKSQWAYVLFGVLAPLGTLLATRGIVSDDRHHGFHRFLFAKPVRLVRFYAQSMAVNFVGVMGTLALVGLLYGLFIAPFSAATAFVPAVVCFVLFGGITFLFSTLSRLDWVWTLGSIAASAWVGLLFQERGVRWLGPLAAVLPPVKQFGRMVAEWLKLTIDQGSLETAISSTAWPLAYGIGAFVAGLVVLKRRSIVR